MNKIDRIAVFVIHIVVILALLGLTVIVALPVK